MLLFLFITDENGTERKVIVTESRADPSAPRLLTDDPFCVLTMWRDVTVMDCFCDRVSVLTAVWGDNDWMRRISRAKQNQSNRVTPPPSSPNPMVHPPGNAKNRSSTSLWSQSIYRSAGLRGVRVLIQPVAKGLVRKPTNNLIGGSPKTPHCLYLEFGFNVFGKRDFALLGVNSGQGKQIACNRCVLDRHCPLSGTNV